MTKKRRLREKNSELIFYVNTEFREAQKSAPGRKGIPFKGA
jgi:hypothetical protein